ncbi:MAG TPA: DegT/DnrJ/EryC1/StrS family aminotransferase, partial [Chitinophagaceae bacterium]|nr:DegT/DnrJ/EryC1/StrS family aminotransferase [Chitinophagaceae bacterium]
NDKELAGRLTMVANHGQSKKYYHDMVGCNSRLDSMQAVILDIKLKHLDEYIAARRKAADHYDRPFGDHPRLKIPYRPPYSRHVFHQYTLIVDVKENPAAYRDSLKDFLAASQIPSMIYYPVPGHKQKMFEAFNTASNKMPVTDWLTERVISLPMHTELDEEQMDHIVTKVLEFLDK